MKAAIISRYPHVAQPPPDAPQGLDTPLPEPPSILWDSLGNLIPVSPPPEIPPPGEDPPGPAIPGSSSNTLPPNPEGTVEQKTTWHDVALGIAAEFMMKMRNGVKEDLGYTTSAVSSSRYITPSERTPSVANRVPGSGKEQNVGQSGCNSAEHQIGASIDPAILSWLLRTESVTNR